MYIIKRLLNPEMFQGRYKKKNYFEGWYFKLIDQSTKTVLAVIPGVAYGKSPEEAHAFVQVIDAVKCKTGYFTYDISEFRFSSSTFEAAIGNNFFSSRGISLDLKDENSAIYGKLVFENIVPFPKTLFNPGIMGPFSFVPRMECYHGIVNIHHEIRGGITVNHQPISFDNGYGYIEKDWGRSFPEAWAWLQSNHFDCRGVSVMFSIAKIPWFHRHFTGFISFLKLGDKLYRFATYTGARVRRLEYRNNVLEAVLEDRKYQLHIKAAYSEGGILKAPKNGLMSREISESISAVVDVALYDKNGQPVFTGQGWNTAMEIAGDIFQ